MLADNGKGFLNEGWEVAEETSRGSSYRGEDVRGLVLTRTGIDGKCDDTATFKALGKLKDEEDKSGLGRSAWRRISIDGE